MALTHNLHRTKDGLWMYQHNGVWYPFDSDKHFIDTRDFGPEYPIAFFKKVCTLPRG